MESHHIGLAERSKVIVLGDTVHQNTGASLYVKQRICETSLCVSDVYMLNSEHHYVLNRKQRSHLKTEISQKSISIPPVKKFLFNKPNP